MAGDKLPAQPPKGEVASIARQDLAQPWVDRLLRQPQDGILQARGLDLSVYTELLSDDQVHATFQQRRLAVVSCEWEVEAGGTSRQDRMAADSLREQLQAIDWDGITNRMLYGLFYGWSVAEVLWMREGRQVAIDAIKVRKREWFRWDWEGRLRLVTLGRPEGELLPPGKFWTFTAGADTDDDPYGLGLAHHLYWPVFFKRGGLKLWLIFLDKFGQPTAVGKYPAGSTGDEEKAKLLQALASIHTEAGIIVPEGMAIELLEAARSGSADYDALQERMNSAISKVVLSQTMTTDDGSSRAQGQVHMDVREEVVKADADLVCGSFNRQVAAWLTHWNFPGAAAPRVWRKTADAPDLKAEADRDEVLYRIGWEPTPKRVREVYGDGYQRREAVRPLEPDVAPDHQPEDAGDAAPAAFAEQETDRPAELADLLESAAEPILDRMMEPVRRLVLQAGSLEEIRDGLARLYPDLETEACAELLARAVLAAELAGRADVADGAEAAGNGG